MFVMPFSAARERARSSIAGVASMPVACRRYGAKAQTTMPPPQARSRSLSSGSGRAASMISFKAASFAIAELKALYRAAGLGEPRTSFYELRDTVTNLLARSFPNPGDDKKIIAMFETAISDDRLGIPVRRPAGSQGVETLDSRDPVA